MKTEQKWKICDCLEGLPEILKLKVDLILTDPPYPDYHVDLYKQCDISFLSQFNCKQLIFWSAKCSFPLNYDSIHIWDKNVGCGSQYERIFERNGRMSYKVYRHTMINGSLCQNFNGEKYFNHPSQKPISIMERLIKENTNEGDMIFDPFLGSGTTLEACMNLNRNCIGFEIDSQWEPIYRKRLRLDNTKLDAFNTSAEHAPK